MTGTFDSQPIIYRLLANIGNLQANFRRDANTLAQQITQEIQKVAPIDSSPEPRRAPGTLQESLFPVVEETKAGAQIIVRTNDSLVANVVLSGSVPHFIPNAVSRKNLVIQTDGGLIVRRGPVHHPGTSPNPFPEKADSSIRSLVNKKLDEMLRSLGK